MGIESLSDAIFELGRCINYDAVSASLLPFPVIHEMDVWVLVWKHPHVDDLNIGPPSVEELILPHIDHLPAAALSTLVEICSNGSISGTKTCR